MAVVKGILSMKQETRAEIQSMTMRATVSRADSSIMEMMLVT